MARERGVLGVWFAALGKLGYRRMLVRECPLNRDIPDITPQVPLTFGRLQPDQLPDYHAFRSTEIPEKAAQRLAEGQHCFVARHHGEIVCACWAATGRAWSAYLSRPIPLAQGEAYLYDIYTRPEMRGQGVAEALRVEMYRWYRDRGFRRVLSYMIPEHHGAMSRSLGFHNIGRVGRVRIAGRQYDFLRMAPGALAPGEAPHER